MKSAQTLINFYSTFRPLLDVALLSFVIYKAYSVIIKTNGLQVIKAALIVVLVYALSLLFHLQTVVWIFNSLAPVLLIAFAIVFQPELRKMFLKLGQSQWFAFGEKTKHTYIDNVLLAAEELSKKRRGMLVVFFHSSQVIDEKLLEGGTRLNSDLSSSLLVTIFGMDTPLHDGACLIQNGKLVAAGCFLPLSEQNGIKKTFGTRHRAALGMSEQSDCVILVVSEESGAMSLAYDSNLYYKLQYDEITRALESILEITPDQYILDELNNERISKA